MTQARGFFKTLRGVYEATYGTTPAVASGDMAALPFNDLDLGSEEEMIQSNTIRGNRYQAEPSFGNINVQGRVTVPLDVRNLGHWIKLLMGSPSTTGSNPYTHVFTPGNTNPSMTLEQGFSDITSYQRFTGCKVNGMSFNFTKNVELVSEIDLLGKSESTDTSSLDAYATELVFNKFNPASIILEEGGSSVTTIRSLNLNVRNELAQDVYCLDGTGFRNSLPETNFIVEGDLEILFENLDLYNKAVNGTESSLQVTLTSGSYSLVIDIYELKFPRRPVTSSGSEPVYLNLPFQAYYQDDAAGVPIKMTLINDVAAYTT